MSRCITSTNIADVVYFSGKDGGLYDVTDTATVARARKGGFSVDELLDWKKELESSLSLAGTELLSLELQAVEMFLGELGFEMSKT